MDEFEAVDCPPQVLPDILTAVRSHTDLPIRNVINLGGSSNLVFRVQLEEGTLIACRRKSDRGALKEFELLSALSGKSPSVPEIYGQHLDILLQEDAGHTRLSMEISTATPDRRRELTKSVFESLWDIKKAVESTDFVSSIAPVGSKATWQRKFANRPLSLSERAGWTPPALDVDALTRSLHAPTDTFVSWDARLGNGSLNDAGHIMWYDWEYYGLRAGVEDFSFILGDEFFPLDAHEALAIFDETCPPEFQEYRDLMIRFAVLRCVRRLSLIHARWRRKGREKMSFLLKNDLAGYAPKSVNNLCMHGAQYATMDPLTEPLVPWFLNAAKAVNWNG